jgi:hypothetical protein
METTRLHRVAGRIGDRSSLTWSGMRRVRPHFPPLAPPHEDLPRTCQALWTHGREHYPWTTRGQPPLMSPGTMRRESMAGAMSPIGRGTMSPRRARRSSVVGPRHAPRATVGEGGCGIAPMGVCSAGHTPRHVFRILLRYRIRADTASWAHVRVWRARPAGADQRATGISALVELLHHPDMACMVLAALVCAVLNGFHDAANAMATSVGTWVLRPLSAVLWAA